MEKNKCLKTTELTKIALLVALLSVSSYIIIPLPFSPVSITAQTIVINLIALILTAGQTAITIGIWVLLGAVGFPVFSGGTGGLGRLFGPTGGYILGYFIAAIVISLLKGKKNQMFHYCVVTIILGIPIIYLFGWSWMKFVTEMEWKASFFAAVVPFFPGDIVKCIMASMTAVVLNKVFLRMGVGNTG